MDGAWLGGLRPEPLASAASNDCSQTTAEHLASQRSNEAAAEARADGTQRVF